MVHQRFLMLFIFFTPHVLYCLPLFDHYPSLAQAFPHIALGSLPTPVQHLKQLEKHLATCTLYIKRDDLSGPKKNGRQQLGSNKVRSFEFFLADALQQGAKSIITSGSAGSHQALLTAMYASQAGLTPYILLYQQHQSETTKRNLLMHLYYGSHLYHFNPAPGALEQRTKEVEEIIKKTDGSKPYYIGSSGSIFPGLAGFVNAGFELKNQVDAGDLPEPDFLYITCATMGSAAGLMVGVRAAGLKTKIIAVTVKHAGFDKPQILKLTREINQRLHQEDPTFPVYTWDNNSFDITHEFLAPGYAIPSAASRNAVELMLKYENITLDNTYTGKTFAAIIADSQAQKLTDKTVLFWYTFPSQPCTDIIEAMDYKKLPKEFHYYFKKS